MLRRVGVLALSVLALVLSVGVFESAHSSGGPQGPSSFRRFRLKNKAGTGFGKIMNIRILGYQTATQPAASPDWEVNSTGPTAGNVTKLSDLAMVDKGATLLLEAGLDSVAFPQLKVAKIVVMWELWDTAATPAKAKDCVATFAAPFDAPSGETYYVDHGITEITIVAPSAIVVTPNVNFAAYALASEFSNPGSASIQSYTLPVYAP